MDQLHEGEIRLQPAGPIPPGPWQDAGALRTGIVAPYFDLEEQLEYEPPPVSSTGLSWPASGSHSSTGSSASDYGWLEVQAGNEGDEDVSGSMDVDEDD